MNAIIDEIDTLESYLLKCRAVFPTLNKKSIGKKHYSTAPFYKYFGYHIEMNLQKEITSDFISRHNLMGQWINENAIIRLYGILSYHNLLKKIDANCVGWKEVDLLRRMRDVFTKTSFEYKPTDKINVRLRQEIISHFNIKTNNFSDGTIPDRIPTPIDAVIMPIFKKCREYVNQKLQLISTTNLKENNA